MTIKIFDNDFNLKCNYVNKLYTGDGQLSLEEIKLKQFIIKVIFNNKNVYDYFYSVMKDISVMINDKNIIGFIHGSTIVNIHFIYNNYNANMNIEDIKEYNEIFGSISDLDYNLYIKEDNAVNDIQDIFIKKQKEIIENKNILKTLKYSVISYLIKHKEYKDNVVKFIRQSNSNLPNKYDKLEKYNIFIRYNKINNTYLFRYMCSYKIDNKYVWVELFDCTLNVIEILNDDYINDLLIKIKSIIFIIKSDKNSTIDDIPKTEDIHDIPNILYHIHMKIKPIFIKINNINVLKLEMSVIENILILLNEPDNSKNNKRYRRIKFLLKFIDTKLFTDFFNKI